MSQGQSLWGLSPNVALYNGGPATCLSETIYLSLHLYLMQEVPHLSDFSRSLLEWNQVQ